MQNIIKEIIEILNRDYNGTFVSEEEGADLFVHIDGHELTIEKFDTENIYFEIEEYNVNLTEASMEQLTYLLYIIKG